MQGCLLVDSHKSTGVDLYAVQRAVPARNQTNKKHNQKQRKPRLRLQKSYQFQVLKTNPKRSLFSLLVFVMRISLSNMLMKESKACKRGASRLPSFVVVPVSVLSASPAPRVVLFALWSSLHPGVLVPPSSYLVAAVTAQLPCFHVRSVVKLCYPSVIRVMATKATSSVWGFHPLHHVTGDVGKLSSAILSG